MRAVTSETPPANADRIGGASHGRRNLWLVLGLGIATVAMIAYYVLLGRHNTLAMDHLEQFRAVYARQCKAPTFAGPAPAMLKELYLSSSALQTAIDQELVAIEAGASCDAVYKALRAADFPVAAP